MAEATARFAKPLAAQTYNIARGKGKRERGGRGKIYLQAVIINQHHAASSTFLDKSTFSIRNFGRPVGSREERGGMHAVEILHLSVVYN